MMDIARTRVRTLQVMAAGLIGGVVVTLLVVLILRIGKPFDWSLSLLQGVGIAAAAGAIAVSQMLPLSPRANRGDTATSEPASEAAAWNTLQTAFIMRMAPLEGAGMLNAILLLQPSLVPLAVVAVVLLWMAGQFPTLARLERQLTADKR